ncbi:MAG: YibE/F family protein [Staphylococcus simulans]|uniref:YibE/F family protein n=1 Tax=Staphylococcus simulans TaxID=1286 RepID=UPI002554D649|nr:YibE/F family protein [Staphylococcus simulans]MDK7926625.1 YibE/F family protein [Staphylococcus simulans]MDK8315170.1 YibE/F family protein [Staphylococcus simulans]
MSFKQRLHQPFSWVLISFAVIFIASLLFTLFNARFYHMPIGEITKIHHQKSVDVTDEHHNQDTKYTEQLNFKVLNGKFEGQTGTIKHTYYQSQVDSEKFHVHNKVLLHINKHPNDATIIEKKRDTLVVAITGIFLLIVLWVGRKVGIQSILSLIINSGAILGAIAIHNAVPSVSLFWLMSLAVILATVITLLLVTGWHWRTLITVISTLFGTFICVGIAELVIQATGGSGIKYETMDLLTLPPKEVFMASVIVGTLGAVMDVAITIASGMYEIKERTPAIDLKRWALAGRHIGQDIMGTMTNILLFSYLAGSLPMMLIHLRNANTITYTISMNWSLEIARALIGGIGIVLTIPVTILLMELWVKVRGEQT